MLECWNAGIEGLRNELKIKELIINNSGIKELRNFGSLNRREEVGRRRSDVGGRTSDVSKKKTEECLSRSEYRGQMSDVRRQMSDVRCQMSDVRCQMSAEPVSMNNMLPAGAEILFNYCNSQE